MDVFSAYFADTINVVGSKFQAYPTRPNGSVGRSRAVFCTCRILMKYNDFYWFFSLQTCENKVLYAKVNLTGILAIKTMQRWKKSYGKMTSNTFTPRSCRISLRADVSYFLMLEEGNRGSARRLTQAPSTKIKSCNFYLHRYTNSIEYPDRHSVLSRRNEALIRQR